MLRTLPYIALYITRRGITESSPELADVLYQYPAQVGMMLVMMVVMMLMMIMIVMMMMMCSHSTVEEVSQNEIRITWGVGIVGHVAQTGLSCNVSDCYQDSRWGNVSPTARKIIDNRIDYISPIFLNLFILYIEHIFILIC